MSSARRFEFMTFIIESERIVFSKLVILIKKKKSVFCYYLHFFRCETDIDTV